MGGSYVEQLGDSLRAKRMPFDEIPVVDLAPLSGEGDRSEMARAIHHALRNTGFMYITNHGVPEELIREAFDMAARFFALPDEQKMALHIGNSGVALRGYTEVFGENTDPDRTRDLKEVFDLGREARDGRIRPFFGPNAWPEQLPEFGEVFTRYHDAMLDLAQRLMQGIALSLDLPAGVFDPELQEPVAIQRVLHYPPQGAVRDDSLIGIGAHTDYGCLTILAQDKVGGLQVMTRDGDWISAPPISGTFIINIGDIMQRLTNDVYLANMHRVINTSGRERYSLPFFFDFDFDTVVVPMESCVTPDNPRKYDPVVSGEHKWQRYQASFPHLEKDTL